MTVSFVIVAYNEAQTLPRLLEDLCAQDYPHDKIEVLLIDSMSTDDTRNIMDAFAVQQNGFSNVLVLENTQKLLAAGCNLALKHYCADAIVRIDAHASIPSDFISKNVKVLESGEYVSGGMRPNIIDEETPVKRTLLTAEQSMFGSGIAAYRNSNQKRYVSSIFHGMYRREVYDAVGEYNVLLGRTEDNDMSYRIRKAGYQICYDPEIISYQHTRNSLKGMLRQKYLNGYWIGKTMGINPRCFSVFHFIPFAFIVGIVITTVLAVMGCPLLSVLMWSAYGLLVLIMTVMALLQNFSLTLLLLPVLFLLLHISYGAGTLVGLAEMPFWLRKIKL